MTVTPARFKEVHVGETASFNCSGVGSFINITWRFNNSLICNSEVCDSALLSYHQDSTINKINNFTIESTLTINTSLLRLHSQDSLTTFTIECRVEQNMPTSLNLSGEDLTFQTNLTVLSGGKYSTSYSPLLIQLNFRSASHIDSSCH